MNFKHHLMLERRAVRDASRRGAHAQTRPTRPPRPPRTNTIEELVVTAEKREQNLQDVPVAISAFTDQQARDRRDQVDPGHDQLHAGPAVHHLDRPHLAARRRPPDQRAVGRRLGRQLQRRRLRDLRRAGRALDPVPRPGRDPARTAGHALRPQLDRRRAQRHLQAADRGLVRRGARHLRELRPRAPSKPPSPARPSPDTSSSASPATGTARPRAGSRTWSPASPAKATSSTSGSSKASSRASSSTTSSRSGCKVAGGVWHNGAGGPGGQSGGWTNAPYPDLRIRAQRHPTERRLRLQHGLRRHQGRQRVAAGLREPRLWGRPPTHSTFPRTRRVRSPARFRIRCDLPLYTLAAFHFTWHADGLRHQVRHRRHQLSLPVERTDIHGAAATLRTARIRRSPSISWLGPRGFPSGTVRLPRIQRVLEPRAQHRLDQGQPDAVCPGRLLLRPGRPPAGVHRA